MNDAQANKPAPPEIQRRRWHVSLVWLVPLVAALVGLSMLFRAWQDIGPTIEIRFATAGGLSAGKTPVQYRDVVVGRLTELKLSEDHSGVIGTVELNRSGEAFTREDTRFWVVRPQIDASGVSGLETLLSGGYIAADPGTSSSTSKSFEALDSPPQIIYDQAGSRFQVEAGDLGSLSVGSPVYYRRVPVGQVVSYGLADSGESVNIEVFVSAPHDRQVTDTTRFWNASGIDLDLGTGGVNVDMQSLVALVTGGLAFGSPPEDRQQRPPAGADARFQLFSNREQAMAPQKGPSRKIRMRFTQSLRGLEEGASVGFIGKTIGTVSRITLDYDSEGGNFPVIVEATVYPRLMGNVYQKFLQSSGQDEGGGAARELFAGLVGEGLRAEARTSNLLSGKLYIALEVYPDAEPATMDSSNRGISVPTRPSGLDRAQSQLINLVDRLNKVPFESIAANLDSGLAELNQTLEQINDEVLPATLTTLGGVDRLAARMETVLASLSTALGSAAEAFAADSPEREQLDRVLNEVERMSRSVRQLSDYLRRHPEALLRGRDQQDRSDLRP
ncbi:intermembrane transport protein PqiB [Marinobacter sp.]|uniref:PqiB family protein n=1 Tax=Marinobacter sp. TaxID=50741 RepID=UPI002B493625|nr:MlaD family protein [Marinobacter sp.]HKK57009.1 MlaD family protein [Marinobacter sp.]